MIRIGTVLALYLANLPFVDSVFVALLTLPMLAMVLAGLARIGSKQFQVGDVFWFCLFIYFVISPLQRLHGDQIGGTTAITSFSYEPEEYVAAMIIVVLFCLPFLFVSMETGEKTPASAEPGLTGLLVVNLTSFALFVLSEGGLDRLLLPRLEQDPSQSFIAGMLFLAAQSVTTCLLAARFRVAQYRFAAAIPLLAAVLLLAISRNPFNAPRFILLAVWGPIVLALAGGKVSASKFYIASLLALTVGFPILNITTRSGLSGLSDLSQLSVVGNFFDIPSIDVFDTAVHAVRFMSAHDHLWGEKLTAVVLFFVPRAMWEGKPIVGGLDIGNELFSAGMYGTPNLSFFLGCDFYMDFGFLGVALGGTIAAMLLRSALRSTWGSFFQVDVMHFVIASSLPILLRGPVGAVLPLFTCQMLVMRLAAIPVWRDVTRAVSAAEGQSR